VFDSNTQLIFISEECFLTKVTKRPAHYSS